MRGELMKILTGIASGEGSPLGGKGDSPPGGGPPAAGRMIAMRVHTSSTGFPEHSGGSVEILYMCSGSTRHRVDGGPVLNLEAGELLFLSQHARHSTEGAGKGAMEAGFMVQPAFFDSALTIAGPGNVLASFLADGLRRTGGLSCLHFRAANQPPVQNLVENLAWSLTSPREGADRLNQAVLGLLFMQLLEDLDCLSEESLGQNRPVLAALREIEENYRSADLTRLAGELQVSLPYLSHAVHCATGKTFKELLREKRLARAVALLEGTDLPIDDIIAAVGYDNTSYFYRKFRERYGVSPHVWRKQSGDAARQPLRGGPA